MFFAGWSSQVARWAHNPKVAGSNPVPAIFGDVAQLAERLICIQEVAGSTPVISILFCCKCLLTTKVVTLFIENLI
jgi:hypothetical protein